MDRGKVIREGTPQELKDCCGGDTHVRIRVTDRARTLEAVEALREIGKESVYGVPETGEVSLPAIGGTSMLADVVRRMDAAGIALAELGLKQPTLDDVFLAITGHATDRPNGVNKGDPAESTQGIDG